MSAFSPIASELRTSLVVRVPNTDMVRLSADPDPTARVEHTDAGRGLLAPCPAISRGFFFAGLGWGR
jgi:hypothetical protein